MIAALLLFQAAAPHQGQADQAGTVVVTGRRQDQAAAVRRMTGAISPVTDAERPLARFVQPLCPQVDGLPLAMNRAFEARMRTDAKRIGLEPGGAKCEVNVTVMVVANGQAVIRAMRRTGAAAFGDLGPNFIRRLADDPSPAHLWSITEVRSRDGDRIRGGGDDEPGTLTVRNASILQAQTRVDVGAAVLLLDQAATVGKTVNQLADYAAMRTLASARAVGAKASQPTILRLLDADEPSPPRELTSFDVAYLTALYHGAAIERPQAKVAMMARAITKSLATATTVAPAAP